MLVRLEPYVDALIAPAYGQLLRLGDRVLCIVEGPACPLEDELGALRDARGSPVFGGRGRALQRASVTVLSGATVVMGGQEDALDVLAQAPLMAERLIARPCDFMLALPVEHVLRAAGIFLGHVPLERTTTVALWGQRAPHLARDILGLRGPPALDDATAIMRHRAAKGPVVDLVDRLYVAMREDCEKRKMRVNFGAATRAVFATYIYRHVWPHHGLHLFDQSLPYAEALARFDAQQHLGACAHKGGRLSACRAALKRWGGRLPGPSALLTPDAEFAEAFCAAVGHEQPLLVYDAAMPVIDVQCEPQDDDDDPMPGLEFAPPLEAGKIDASADWPDIVWTHADCGDVTLLCTDVSCFVEDARAWREAHPHDRLEVLIALDMEYLHHVTVRSAEALHGPAVAALELDLNTRVTTWSSAALRASPDHSGLHDVLDDLIDSRRLRDYVDMLERYHVTGQVDEHKRVAQGLPQCQRAFALGPLLARLHDVINN